MEEDNILAAQHPAYAAFLREDEVKCEYDPWERGEAEWEAQDGR